MTIATCGVQMHAFSRDSACHAAFDANRNHVVAGLIALPRTRLSTPPNQWPVVA